MNTEEAKSILQAFRPNGADQADALIAEALALADSDPALREWFSRQRAFDQRMVAEYEAVQPPRDLRARILAAGDESSGPVVHISAWRRPRVGLALVAGIAVLVSAGALLWPKPKLPAADSALANFVIGDAQHPKTHGGRGEEAAALNRTLKLPTTKLSSEIPVNFAQLRNTGCRTVQLDGRDVLEVCFKRNGVGLHYYVARREDFPNLSAPPTPTISDKPNASIATWEDKGNLYIVVTEPGRAALEKLL